MIEWLKDFTPLLVILLLVAMLLGALLIAAKSLDISSYGRAPCVCECNCGEGQP